MGNGKRRQRSESEIRDRPLYVSNRDEGDYESNRVRISLVLNIMGANCTLLADKLMESKDPDIVFCLAGHIQALLEGGGDRLYGGDMDAAIADLKDIASRKQMINYEESLKPKGE